jgi:hypothetical protein
VSIPFNTPDRPHSDSLAAEYNRYSLDYHAGRISREDALAAILDLADGGLTRLGAEDLLDTHGFSKSRSRDRAFYGRLPKRST